MRSAQTRTEQQRFTAMHRGLAAAAEAIETARLGRRSSGR
jgi:hypothetical protein